MLGIAQSELSSTEESILKLSLVLTELERQKRRQSESVLAMKAALSPIRRIPPELLAQRRDASGTCLVVLAKSPFQTPSFPSFVDQILARSGDLPLHVQVAADTVLTWPVLCVLFRYHARLETIRLAIASPDVSLHASLERRTFPLLTSVQVNVRDVSGFDARLPAMLSVFNDAPRFRTAIISGDCPPTQQSLLPALAWAQLTVLDLKIPISLLDVRDILTLCVRLRTASVSTLDADELQLATHITQLPYLHDLEIVIENEDTSMPPDLFFEAFSFPGLKYLLINAMAWSPLTLLRLYERSQFRLEKLVLCFLALDADDLIQFLAHLPLLQTLVLESCAVTDELFRAFTYQPNLMPPRLTLLHLRDISLLGYSDEVEGSSVANLAESIVENPGHLNPAFPRLESLSFRIISSGPPFDSDIEGRLAAASRSGVFSYSLK
ncbi:hypothetical protein B0H11DRAFT_2223158 [Mycena galericulata]|nr:hypothetical protein B0H11DRAFT_2223158 [Mycena galericulata]